MQGEVNSPNNYKHWNIILWTQVPAGVKVLDSVWRMKRKQKNKPKQVYKWKARLNVHSMFCRCRLLRLVEQGRTICANMPRWEDRQREEVETNEGKIKCLTTWYQQECNHVDFPAADVQSTKVVWIQQLPGRLDMPLASSLLCLLTHFYGDCGQLNYQGQQGLN